MSQIAISEASANCFAEQAAKSNVGKYTLDTESFNIEIMKLPQGEQIHLTSSTIKEIFGLSIFEEMLGENIPMKVDFSYRNMDMKFGVSDWVDISMEYIL